MSRISLKNIVFATIGAMVLFVGCGSNVEKSSNTNNEPQTNQTVETSQATETTEKSGTADALEQGKAAYEDLNNVTLKVDEIMSTVYNGWSYTIYDYDFSSILNAVGYWDIWGKEEWATNSGIDFKKFKNVFAKLVIGGDPTTKDDMTTFASCYGEPAYLIAGIIAYYQDEGVIDTIDNAMAEVKNNIKTISDIDPNASYLQGLKDYYSEMNSYYEFVKSPTGNFAGLNDTVETYRTNLKKYKNDLEFDLG